MELSKQSSFTHGSFIAGKKEAPVIRTTLTSRRESKANSFMSQNSDLDLGSRVTKVTKKLQKLQ